VLHTNNSMSTDQSADQSVRYTLFSGFYTQRTAANHMFFHEYLPVNQFSYFFLIVII